jgi:hypothetical protein
MATSLHRHRSARWNERELIRLFEAIEQGRWVQAGMHREFVDGHVAGYWKVMSCGCVVALVAVDFDREWTDQ